MLSYICLRQKFFFTIKLSIYIYMLEYVLLLGAYLFCLGIYGLVTSRNMIRALMCLELMLNGVNVNLIGFSTYLDPVAIKGQVFVIFIIAIAAAEAAIGLAIILNIYRNRNSARIDQFDLLKW